jgi:hypothetical protein
MHPVSFPGSFEIKKPADMTDEECFSVHAVSGVDEAGFPYYLTAWKPSYEDLQALQRGEPIYVKTVATGLPPMILFTVDEKGHHNDAG